MKKLLLFICLSLFLKADIFAQQNIDSATYQRQRQKINSMLAVRSQKFSVYDKSLAEHTGIFGLQTKKDIRRSNDILMDIVKTDNEIYNQLKILLDYRVFQQEQAIDKSKEAEGTALESMYTINRLQNQLEKLRKEKEAKDTEQAQTSLYYKIGIFVLIAIILFLLSRLVRRKEQH